MTTTAKSLGIRERMPKTRIKINKNKKIPPTPVLIFWIRILYMNSEIRNSKTTEKERSEP